MSASRAFDRAVGFYDQTRRLPESMASEGLNTILELAAGEPMLEVGVGTGRLGVPLRQRGADLFGCDLSHPMLLRLREKDASFRLARADAARLPFRGRSFALVLTAHVLHLVSEWQTAISEIRRVLRPGGLYVNVLQWQPPEAVHIRLRNHWRRELAQRVSYSFRPGAESPEAVTQAAVALGASFEDRLVARYESALRPAEVLDGMAGRIFSDTWDAPEQAHQAALAATRAWAQSEYGDLERPRVEEHHLHLHVYRFGAR